MTPRQLLSKWKKHLDWCGFTPKGMERAARIAEALEPHIIEMEAEGLLDSEILSALNLINRAVVMRDPAANFQRYMDKGKG